MIEQNEQQNPSSDFTTGTVFDYTKKKKKTSFTADEISPEIRMNTAKTFTSLNLESKLIESVNSLGWKEPTPVQGLCLPITVAGRDVAGFAQTGTGKTGVFLITLAQRLLTSTKPESKLPRAIVLAPTRELAMQICDDAKSIFDPNNLKAVAVFGGVDYDKQAKDIKAGVDVIVATPGRLKDYVQKKVVDLSKIEVFICDEADRMFDMGFIEDVEFFLEKIEEDAQKLLFSATTNADVKELAFEYLDNPEYIAVNPEEITPEKITQKAIHVNATNKLKVMLGLLKDDSPECAIIFTNTKLTAEWLHYKLSGNGIDVDLMSGALAQNKRIKLIQKIKEGKINALIATDVASRGLHISRVSHVYNFDIPDDPSNYIHRIGRTARAGAKGTATSLVCDDYGQNFPAVIELLGESSTVTSGWFEEKYLEIEDKAGDPFAAQIAAGRESRPERSPRPSHNKPRPDRKGANASKPNQERNKQRSNSKGKGKGKGKGNDRNRKNKEPHKSAQGQQGQNQRNKTQQKSVQQQPAASASVGGLFKKMVKAILGK